jgi:hypothetical protein
MNRENFNNAKMFIGAEVEHTPAFSKKTLFVVGMQPIEEIVDMARKHKASHIFMGANHSFNDTIDAYWDQSITALLDRGFWVTLDYEAHLHEKVLVALNKGIWQSRLFVPLLSVRIPNIQMSSPNLTVKIDDIDFKATNPGVWCMHFREVTDSNRFTDWVEYDTDVVIGLESKSDDHIDLNSLQSVEFEAPRGSDAMGRFNDVAPSLPSESQQHLERARHELQQKRETATIKADEGLKNPIEDKNNANLGLDLNSDSSLKPDPGEVIAEVTPVSMAQAAEMYADGATVDPLSKEGSRKIIKVKK